MKTRRLILNTLFLSLAPLALAGQGGISPTDGTYTFERSDGRTVGTGTFTSSGGSHLASNPSSGGTTNYTKDSMGTYVKTPVSDGVTICFNATQSGTPPYSYEYKYLGDVVSEGHLIP